MAKIRKFCCFLVMLSLVSTNFIPIALAEETDAVAPVESPVTESLPVQEVAPSVQTELLDAVIENISSDVSIDSTPSTDSGQASSESSALPAENIVPVIPEENIVTPTSDQSSSVTEQTPEILGTTDSIPSTGSGRSDSEESSDSMRSTTSSTTEDIIASTTPDSVTTPTITIPLALESLGSESSNPSMNSESSTSSTTENITATSTLTFPDLSDLNTLEDLISEKVLVEEKINPFASTTIIVTETAELTLPEKLSSPMIIRYNNKISEVPLEISVIDANATSTLSGKEINYIYQDALPSTDLQYEITKRGVKESIILKDTNHPTEYKYQINLDQFDSVQTSPNIITLYQKGEKDNSLSKLYTLSAPKMIDANGVESTSITFTLENNILILTPDANWLSQATYPVIIDPTIEITVLNVHSHPVQGEYWNVDFTTVGTADLTITPADQATIDDMQFTALSCAGTEVTPQILPGDVIFYPAWSCEGVATVSHLDLKTDNHHLIFTFSNATEEATSEAFNSTDFAPHDLTSAISHSPFSLTGSSQWSATYAPWKVLDGDTGYWVGIGAGKDWLALNLDIINGVSEITPHDLTSNTSHSPLVVSASSWYSTFLPWMTLDGVVDVNHGWYGTGNGSDWISYDFGEGVSHILGGYEIAFSNAANPTRAPKDWTVQGSNNGTDWYVVSTVTNQTNWFSSEYRAFSSDVKSTAYRYFRIVFTANNGDAVYTHIAEVHFYPVITVPSTDKICDSYAIKVRTDATRAPKDWKLYGGNNNGNWDLLDTVAGETGWGSGETRTYTCDVSGTAYGFFRIVFTANNGHASYIEIVEWYLYEPTYRTVTWDGGASTVNWADALNWDVDEVPTANDDVIIPNANVTLAADTTIHSINYGTTGSATFTINANISLIVTATTTLTDGAVNTGNINAQGNVVVASTFDGGTAPLTFTSASDQTFNLTGGTDKFNGDIIVNKASGSVLLLSDITLDGSGQDLQIQSGTFNQNGYNLTHSNAFALSAGTFVGGTATTTFQNSFAISAGTFTAASSTVFSGSSSVTLNVNVTQTFENLIFSPGNNYTKTISSGDTMVVTGTLTLTDGLVNTGTIDARGDIIQASTFDGGTAIVDFGDDSVAQTWTVAGGTTPIPRFNSTADASDSIILSVATTFYGLIITSDFPAGTTLPITNTNYLTTIGNGDWTQASGMFAVGTDTMTFNDTFSQSGGTFTGGTATTTFAVNFTISGGTFTAASTTVFGGGDSATLDVATSQTFEDVIIQQSNVFSRTIATNDTLVVTGDLTLSDGYLNANSGGTVNVRGNVTAAPTFDGGTSRLTFSGSAVQTFNLTGVTGSLNSDITINKTGGEVDLLSALVMDNGSQDLVIQEGTFDLNGNSLTVNGSSGTLVVQDGGNLQLAGSETITANANNPQLLSGSTVTYDGASSYTLKDYAYKNLTIAGAGTFATPNTTEDVYGNFSQTAGIFTAPSDTLTVFGNFSHTAGTFTHNSGTVSLTGGSQSITGNTTFNNFTKATSTTDTLTFASGSTQTIEGTMTLTGAASNLLALRSDSDGTQWNIDPQGTRTISYLNVQDSNNVNATSIDASAANSVSSGNNTNWDFGETFAQSDYRWYENIDNITPTTAEANQNTSLTLTSVINPLRLRMNVLIGAVDLVALSRSFTLQVSNLLSGGWSNVGATSTVSFFNNPSVSSGTTLSGTLLSNSTITGTYEETATSSPNPLLASIGDYLEYDFSLNVSNLIDGIVYYFRLILGDGTTLDTYTNYAEVTYDANATPDAPSLTSPIDGAWTTDTTPIFVFSLSDSDAPDTLKYHILIDNDSNFSSPVVNYTSALQAQGATSYTPSALSDSASYYWRVSASDNSGVASATTTANSGNIAFKVDATAPTAGTLIVSSRTAAAVTVGISGASDATSGLSATPYVFANTTLNTYNSATALTSATFSTLTPNTLYAFIASTTDAAGNNAQTGTVSTTTLANVPSSALATADSAIQVTVSWNANSNPDGTEYFVDNTTAGTNSGWGTAVSYAFTGLTCATTYSFTVKARNGDGVETTATDAVTQTTSACPATADDTPPGNGSGSSSGNNGGGGGGVPLPGIIINGGATTTASSITYLTIYAPFNATSMALSNTPGFESVAVLPFSNYLSYWNLCEKNVCQAGTYTVYVKFYSTLGIPSEIYSDDIYVSGKLKMDEPPGKPPRDTELGVIITASLDGSKYFGSLNQVPAGQNIYLQGSVSGKKPGEKLTYKFDCESDARVDGVYEAIFEDTPRKNIKTGPICSYKSPGNYLARVEILSSSLTIYDSLLIQVGNPIITLPPVEPPVLPPLPIVEPPIIVPPIIEPPIVPPIVPPLPEPPPPEDISTSTVIEIVDNILESVTNTAQTFIIQPVIIVMESVVSVLSGASSGAVNLTQNVVNTTIKLARTGQEKLAVISDNPEISAGVSTLVVAPSALMLQYSLTTGEMLSGIGSLSDIWFTILGFFQGLLTSIGIRTRRRYWGTVYDSRTKQPIDPAIVELVDADSGKVLETSITDLIGRFGFLDQRGQYYIRARKTHYIFPSKIVTETKDSIFDNVYHGELIKITKSDDLLTPNIPMDSVAFDWNQQEKLKVIKFHPNLELAIQAGLNTLFWLGFAFIIFNLISHQTVLNMLFTALYIALIALRKFIPSRKLWGRIESDSIDTSGLLLELSPKQIPQVIVARAMTNKRGKFFLKTSEGDYILKIKKIDGSNLVTILESETSVGKNGVVNETIAI